MGITRYISINKRDNGTHALVKGSKWPRYKLSLEEVDALLGMIYELLKIKKEQVSLSLHDPMYQTLKEGKGRIFPVHSAFSESIRKEKVDPEKKMFSPKSLKRRFPL